jgi:hypothetical protein
MKAGPHMFEPHAVFLFHRRSLERGHLVQLEEKVAIAFNDDLAFDKGDGDEPLAFGCG